MAKAYWIVHQSVHDPERYPEYLTAAMPIFQKFGAHFRGARAVADVYCRPS